MNIKHDWICISPGEYDSLYECRWCGLQHMESADNPNSYLSEVMPYCEEKRLKLNITRLHAMTDGHAEEMKQTVRALYDAANFFPDQMQDGDPLSKIIDLMLTELDDMAKLCAKKDLALELLRLKDD